MFKRIISIALALILTALLVVPTFAASEARSFTDVASDYWGKASIDYISGKGYMIGYGSIFGVDDNVTEGQYLAVLSRILGYESQSPLTVEDPARELGLVKDNETIDVLSELNRGNIAKYTIRAYELLNPDTTYPDYLEAYGNMMKDYESLNNELKTVVLKCFEKGLLAGYDEGYFNAHNKATRAHAAAFIHRLLVQDERDKIKPIFAEPDKEFEDFINSEESREYIWDNTISRVVDGIIIWKKNSNEDLTEYLLPVYYNRNVNKTAYEALRTLTEYARQNKNYIAPKYKVGRKGPYIRIEYHSARATSGGTYNLLLEIETWASQLREDQKLNSDYYWEVMSLGNSYHNPIYDRDEIVRTKATSDEFKLPLKAAFIAVYGEEAGNYIYDYSINEWNNCWDSIYSEELTYKNDNSIHIEKYNLEIQNYIPYLGGSPKFGTNDINK